MKFLSIEEMKRMKYYVQGMNLLFRIQEGYAKASAGVATMKGGGDGVRMANEWSILKLDVL